MQNQRHGEHDRVAYASTRFWKILRLFYSDLHRSHIVALLGMAPIRPLFEVHVNFFHEKRNNL